MNRAFVSRQIDRLRPRIAAIAHELIDGFASARAVDLLPAFASPIPVIVIAEVLGVPASMAPDLLEWSHRMVAMYQFRRDEEIERNAVAATEAFTSFMRGHVNERRRRPADDLLTALIAAEAEGSKLSEDEMIVTAILLLNAGHEATVHTIGNAVKALLENSPQTVDAFSSGHDVRAEVEELLRFDAPLHLFTRYALEDVDLDGLRIGKGEEIGLLLGFRQSRWRAFRRARPLPSRTDTQPPCQFRRRHPFLRGRAARPPRARGRAFGLVFPVAGPAVGRGAALPRLLSFPRAREP